MRIFKHKKRFEIIRKPAACFIGLFLAFFFYGCQAEPVPAAPGQASCSGFSAASVHFTGLTEFSEEEEGRQTIRVFVELRDVFDSKIKAPGTFRFDLYGYVPHSSDPRGKHLQSWPDFELADYQANHFYWRDYLRAYEFLLEVAPPVSREGSYLLEVTCLTPEPKRMSAFYLLQTKQP